MRARVMRWWLGHTVRSRTGGAADRGMVVWVDAQGDVYELGAYRRDELVSLAWGVDVGYRTTRDRSERIRLARVRGVAHRVSEAARRLPRAEAPK